MVDVGQAAVENDRDEICPQNLVRDGNEAKVEEVCRYPQLPIDNHCRPDFLLPVFETFLYPIALQDIYDEEESRGADWSENCLVE